jgi:hypothetical protein
MQKSTKSARPLIDLSSIRQEVASDKLVPVLSLAFLPKCGVMGELEGAGERKGPARRPV